MHAQHWLTLFLQGGCFTASACQRNLNSNLWTVNLNRCQDNPAINPSPASRIFICKLQVPDLRMAGMSLSQLFADKTHCCHRCIYNFCIMLLVANSQPLNSAILVVSKPSDRDRNQCMRDPREAYACRRVCPYNLSWGHFHRHRCVSLEDPTTSKSFYCLTDLSLHIFTFLRLQRSRLPCMARCTKLHTMTFKQFCMHLCNQFRPQMCHSLQTGNVSRNDKSPTCREWHRQSDYENGLLFHIATSTTVHRWQFNSRGRGLRKLFA